MKLSPFAALLSLALCACASAPKGGHDYALRATICDMPLEVAQELAGRETMGGLPAPAELVEKLRTAAKTRSDVELRSSPRIRVREGNSAEFSSMSETEYVQDWKVDAQGKAEAVHAKAPDGFALEFRPHASEAALELGFKAEFKHLLKPIRKAELTLSNGAKARVDLPEVVGRKIDSKATLAPGECLALMLPGADDAHATLVCVSAVALGPGR